MEPEMSVGLIDHQAGVHDRKKILFKQRKTITNFSLYCGKTVYMYHSTTPQLKNAKHNYRYTPYLCFPPSLPSLIGIVGRN